MKRVLLLLLVVVMILGVMAPALADGHRGDPKKVAICHFDGHDAGTTFGSGDFTGDYVIVFQWDGDNPIGPTATYCEETLGEFAGKMIIVSVNALKGHDVEGLDRLAAYPTGWKG